MTPVPALAGLSWLPTLATPVPALWLQLCVPLTTALLGGMLLRHRRAAGTVAALGAILTVVVSLLTAWQLQRDVLRTSVPTLGPLTLLGWRAPLELAASDQAIVTACLLAVISAVVQAFARWYLAYDERFPAYAAGLSLTSFATQLVLLAGDALLIAVGLGLLAATVHSLTAHWDDEEARTAAARSALTVGTAAALVLTGSVLLALPAHSTALTDVVAQGARSGPTATAGLLLLVVGLLVGAGQLPLVGWTTALTRGPIPTVVGLFVAALGPACVAMVLGLQPLIAAVPAARWTVLAVGGATALVCGVLALVQRDLKDLLALLTASGLGAVLVVGMLDSTATGDAAWFSMAAMVISTSLLGLVVCWMSVLVGATTLARTSRLARHHTSLRFPLAAALLALASLPPFMGFVAQHTAYQATLRESDGSVAAVVKTVVLAGIALVAATACRVWLVLTHQTSHEEYMSRRGLDARGTQIDDFFRISAEPETDYVDDADNDLSGGALVGLLVLGTLCLAGGLVALTPLLELPAAHYGRGAILVAAISLVAALLVMTLGFRRFHNDPMYLLPQRLVDVLAPERWAGLPQGGVVWLVGKAAALVTLADRRGLAVATDHVGTGAKLGARVAQRLHAARPTSALAVVLVGAVVLALAGVVAW